MAKHTAIADVGQTLVMLLKDRIGEPVDDNDIALASPADEGVGQGLRLTVYLYDVTQNEHLSNDADTFLSGSQNLTTTSLENTTTDSTTMNTEYVTDDGSDNEPLF